MLILPATIFSQLRWRGDDAAMMGESDADLVAAMAAGDRDVALAAFLARFGGLVMAVALRILESRAEAEEVFQEIIIELWRRAPDYDPGRASVSAWVSTVARSRSLDAYRARSRRLPLDAGLSREESAAPAAERPDEKVDAFRRRQEVHSLLQALSAVQRQALELAYFHGLSHSEIAEFLDLPLGTIKSRVRAGVRALRHSLAELRGGELS